MFCNDNLADMYIVNFVLKNQFNWSIDEIENLLPYEYKIYLSMTQEYVNQEKERLNKKQ